LLVFVVEKQLTRASGVLLLNRAACQLKMKHWEDAIRDCRSAISQGEDTAKAHYRLAQALVGSKELDGAKAEFARAHELAPEDKAIARDLEKVKKDIVEQRKKDADKYKRMFSS